MKSICFFNQKGGTGKTTSVVNVAAMFAREYKKRVLVIDCDSQMTSTKYLSTYVDQPEYTLSDIIDGEVKVRDALTHIWTATLSGKPIDTSIDLIASRIDIEFLQNIKQTSIKEIYASVEDDYDYCFVDMPPHLSDITISALVASDHVVVVANTDTDSLSGYNYLIDTVKSIREGGLNLNLSILGILFNDVNIQRVTQRMILNSSMESMSLVFRNYIKSASCIEQARYFGIPFPYVGSLKQEVYDSYKALCDEMIERIGK